jgi:hypothetical protein
MTASRHHLGVGGFIASGLRIVVLAQKIESQAAEQPV